VKKIYNDVVIKKRDTMTFQWLFIRVKRMQSETETENRTHKGVFIDRQYIRKKAQLKYFCINN
jgi:hypothetical protein